MYACLNSQVAKRLIAKCIDRLGEYAFCVDQGFPRSGKLYGIFVGPISRRTREVLSDVMRDYILDRSAAYTSLRQAAEWGMRALQGTFSRLKSRLTSDKDKREQLLLAVALIHNFRTHYAGLNQIATVFDPEYEQYTHIDNYDRIARYFHVQ